MKLILLSLIGTICVVNTTFSQSKFNLGAGYFGQTITHPGIVLECSYEKFYSEKVSLPLRLNLGFYSHPRNHNGLFLDINYGFRRHFKNGIFLEESIGIGVLETIINSDGVYEVDDNGNIDDASSFNEPDFSPSLTIGIGYNVTENQNKQNLIWIRPKIYWQIPHKTSSTFNPAIQLGYTYQISGRK